MLAKVIFFLYICKANVNPKKRYESEGEKTRDMNTKRKIAIVAGGDSSEHEVSLRSAQGILSEIDTERYDAEIVVMPKFADGGAEARHQMLEKLLQYDLCYITIHGTPGENGLLAGYLDMMHIPYSNCGVLAGAVTFNKYACNHYMSAFGVRISPSVLLRRRYGKIIAVDHEDMLQAVTALGFPMFIKSNVGGSSFGCTKVKNSNEILPAIERAFQEGDEVVCEAFMKGTEITCGVYKTKDKAVAFPITEVVTHNEFFDYNAKYKGEVDEITPARIPDEVRDRVQQATLRLYDLLGCKGIIRTDYILTPDGKGGLDINLLEVNTTPGMTATSFVPQQIRAAGLTVKEVLTDIIEANLPIC